MAAATAFSPDRARGRRRCRCTARPSARCCRPSRPAHCPPGSAAAQRDRAWRRPSACRSAPCGTRSTNWWPSTSWCGARAAAPSSPRTTPTASCSSSSTSSAATACARCRRSSCWLRARAPGRRGRRGACDQPGEPAMQIENRLSLQGRAVVHDRLTLPAVAVQGPDRKAAARAAEHDLPALPDRVRHHRACAPVERARAVAADRSAGARAGLAPGTPMLQVRRTALTFGDKPVEYRVSTLHTAQHEYVNLVSRPQ